MHTVLEKFIEPSSPQLTDTKHPVIYWMTREHRVHDNRTLVLAQKYAHENNVPLLVVVAFRKDLSNHSILTRTFRFITEGLQDVEKALEKLIVPFVYLQGNPPNEILKLAKKLKSETVFTDLYPIKPFRRWQKEVGDETNLIVVDSHNTVPVWEVSEKKEFAAYTIRPKIWKKFDEFYSPLPKLTKQQSVLNSSLEKPNWTQIVDSTEVINGYPNSRLKGGWSEGKKMLGDFISNRLSGYAEHRNDPSKNATSHLSPYLHFGHLSSHEVIDAVQGSHAPQKDKDGFLEEFVIRKELSDNFCYYENEYRNLKGIHDWAKATLKDHTGDKREYTYSYEELRDSDTHDSAWNAAQTQMVQSGSMHGYMRMYWCKKIFEWTKSPDEAVKIAIKLNDTFSLDGRDPNGYVGILWSIGGLHDRAWTERAIFGKIRYMNQKGLQRKFDIEKYITEWNK